MKPPNRITCPRCFALLRSVVRWRGHTPVAVGLVCVSDDCGFRVVGGAWVVGQA